MKYSVNKLAGAAGVSVRTLHHYDDIGLLTPARQDNGYRLYGDSELLRLQQILLYRDLGVPLPTIKQILDEQDFDYVTALTKHLANIEKEQMRLMEQARTLKKTLDKIKKGQSMTAQDMYAGLTKKQYEEYTEEARAKWGSTEAFKQSVAKVKAMGPAGLKKINDERIEIELELSKLMDRPATDPDVQRRIARHRANINHFYDVTDEIYRGLAAMYVEDPRFAAHYDEVKPGLAQFLCDAMIASLKK